MRAALLILIGVGAVGCSFDPSVYSEGDGEANVAAAPDAGVAQDSAAAEEPGLLAHWTMDDGEGDVLRDVTENGHDGQIDGATWTDGVTGSALRFDGDNDFVALGNPGALAMTGEITVAAWIKIGAADGIRNIVAHGHRYGPDAEYFLRVNDDSYQGGSWDGRDHKAASTLPAINAGTWVHLASVYDGQTWILYENGVAIESSADSTGVVPVAADWAIGARGGGGERFFDGVIDEVRLYDRGLSDDEVADLAQLPL